MTIAETAAPLFAGIPVIEAVYLFGSTAEGTSDMGSDLDFGVLCTRGTDRITCGRLQMDLCGRLILLFKTDQTKLESLRRSRQMLDRYASMGMGKILDDPDLKGALDRFAESVERIS